MSEEKKEARKALLGELESIKDLLSDEEWDHIPLLNDPITAPVPTVSADIGTDSVNLMDFAPSAEALQDELDLAEDELDFAEDELDLAEDEVPVLAEIYTVEPAAPAEPQAAEASLSDDPLSGDPLSDHSPAQPPPPVPRHDTPSFLSQRRSGKRPAVEPRGENPFLPQHIRARLHTHKTLSEVIRESPFQQAPRPSRETALSHDSGTEKEKLPPVLAQEKINHLVDGLIAIYLPKIEAELRAQLLHALQDEQPPAD